MTGLSGIENVAMPLMFRGMDKDKRTRIAKEMLREVGLGNRMKHKQPRCPPVSSSALALPVRL